MTTLCVVATRSAGLQFAVFAFEDEPMRAAMAHVASPLQHRALRFNQLERVSA